MGTIFDSQLYVWEHHVLLSWNEPHYHLILHLASPIHIQSSELFIQHVFIKWTQYFRQRSRVKDKEWTGQSFSFKAWTYKHLPREDWPDSLIGPVSLSYAFLVHTLPSQDVSQFKSFAKYQP